MKKDKNNTVHNNYPSINGEQDQYVRVLKSGIFIAFKTVNNDWCVINTKLHIRKSQSIVEKEPFINCRAVLMHVSDFNNLLPGSNEIPVTTIWPLSQCNNSSRSN